jgi:hypothetical protein
MSAPDRTITHHTSLTREEARQHSIGVELRFELPAAVTEFTVNLPSDIEVRSTNGCTVSGSQVEWDQQLAELSIAGRYDPSQTSMGGFQALDTGGWAVVSQPTGPISTQWQYTGSDIDYESTYDVDGPGAISSDGAIAYLGPHDAYSEETPDERFRLIVPAVARLEHDPSAILASLSHASQALDIGPHNGTVLIIAAPSRESNWGPTGTQFGDEGFWALDRTRLDHPNNTWLHEYVHTRQDFTYDESLAWLVEGSANYFAALLTLRQGLIDFDRFQTPFSNRVDSGAVLSNPGTWSNQRTKYVKGAVVTAALDAELRRRSNGQTELGDVLWTMAKTDQDDLGVADLRSLLRTQRGIDLSDWLDEYVAGPSLPEVPHDPDAFGLTVESPPRKPPSTTAPVDDPDPVDEDDPPSAVDPDPVPETDPEAEPEAEPEDEGTTSTPPAPDSGTCPVCETDVDSDETFCHSCGSALQRTCHVCGGQAPGQEYCPICGTELVSACTVCGYKQRADHTYCQKCGTEL